MLIGAGFVIATTVRTAIIFASVPRGLPATAAALNEASIEVGTRAGIVVVTGILAEVAIAVYAASVSGQPPAQVDALTASFREVLVALGTPAFESASQAVQPAELYAYQAAYFAGVQVALLVGGLVGVVGSIVAWLTLGRRDVLLTVYEHRDERQVAAPPAG